MPVLFPSEPEGVEGFHGIRRDLGFCISKIKNQLQFVLDIDD
jgi:hypothetical protein